jgi:hypothetical protein
MPDPIIVDDGGSTRVKRLSSNGDGEMDGLLNVNMNPLNGDPPQSSDSVSGPFRYIRVVTIGETGIKIPVDSTLAAGDTFTITSANGQFAVGKIGDDYQLTITLKGETNNAPLVEKIVFENQFRYEVTNAGRIQQISGTLNGRTIDPFCVPAQNIYTAVVVSGSPSSSAA